MSASAGTNELVDATRNTVPAMSFYNDLGFIRAENANTGVTSYFNKANLTFQADAETSFFLKSDTFQTYYLFEDVARPMASNVKALMEIFQSWIEDTKKDGADTPLISDDTTTVLEVKTFYDKDPLRVSELLTGDATTAFDAGKNAVSVNITDGATSRAVRQTKTYAPIINNKNMYAVVGATLISDAAALNVMSRAGCFDDNTDITVANATPSGNGVFFQYKSGEGLSLVLRSNITGTQEDIVVPQAQWNIDELNGAGPTGHTLVPSEEQTYIFEWSALKGNVIRAGILKEGFPVFCHKFVDVRMGCASVPLRWEISRADPADTSASSAFMMQSASSVIIQGNSDIPTLTRSKTNDIIKPVTLANSPMPILSLRLRPATNRARLAPRRLRLMNLDPGVAKWSLVLNASALTGATFSDIGMGSFAQFSEAESAVSGGIVLASGFFSDAGAQTIELDEKTLALCADIAGQPDVLSLVVKYLRGVVTVSAAIEWAEME